MIFFVSRIAILLGMFVSVASIGMLLSEQVKSEGEPPRHVDRKSQHELSSSEIELQVPTALQSFLQEGDLTSWHTTEELRVPDSLRMFLQQSEPFTQQSEPFTLVPRQPSP